MKAILRTLVCSCALGFSLSAFADPSYLLNYGNGVTASFVFTHGPGVSDDGKFESFGRVVIHSEALDAKAVRTVAFDAVMHMGRYSHCLTDNRVPKASPLDAASWELSNIFFTMEKKWEGKLTLQFDDGTEQTQWFPIEVKRN